MNEIQIAASSLLQLVCTGLFVAAILAGMLFIGVYLSGE